MSSDTISQILLNAVDTLGSVDTFELSKELQKDHQLFVGAVKSIQTLGEVIIAEQKQKETWVLTNEGVIIANEGSYEAKLFHAIPPDGLLQSSLDKLPQLGKNAKIGFSKAMSNGWIKIDKQAEGGPKILKKTESITDQVQEDLVKLKNGKLADIPDNKLNDLKKRKLIAKEVIKSYLVSKGSEFSLSLSKLETDITTDMLTRFTEMPTNNFVESSFWNFDALFQPQQHPARDAHDTFFLSDPQHAKLEEMPKDYIERVKTMHEKGGNGSIGYQYDWKLEEAKKNILRTHTTAVSTRMLYKLAQQEKFTPVKYFSIDRVFRNESLDATHLAEFHQIEGVVADFNLTLGHLIGVLHQFFLKLGIEKLRFKPAYNPYTEPSMEIFSYHEGLKKWVEIGNSGVFRPELLLPMGLPENVAVIAWGLSLERPTMIKYGISNIRDLIGHKIDLEMVQKNPICRLEEK